MDDEGNPVGLLADALGDQAGAGRVVLSDLTVSVSHDVLCVVRMEGGRNWGGWGWGWD